MRRALIAAALAAGMAAPVMADSLELDRDALLQKITRGEVAQRRSACAMGQVPAMQARLTSAGFRALGAGAYCVTVLTRAGRDGTLGHVRDPRSNQLTSAIAFDNGFVGAYLKREALPAGAPSMMALLPIADRCLDQREPDTDLCNAAGHMLGVRAARGELVPLAQAP